MIKKISKSHPDFKTVQTLAIHYLRGRDVTRELTGGTLTELYNYVESEFSHLSKIVPVIQCVPEDVNCDRVRAEYESTGVLLVSSLHDNSELFRLNNLNLKFRAIHDYHHITKGFQCDFAGEFQSFMAHCIGINEDLTGAKELSLMARNVLFSEIVLQACFALYFGDFPPVQKVVLFDSFETIQFNR